MMKGKKLRSPGFRYVVSSFEEWLDVQGYASQTLYQMPRCTEEFFHYMEEKGKEKLGEIASSDFKDFYLWTSSRSNKRRGGGLCSSYLNKYRQSLLKLSDYLRRSGRLLIEQLEIEFLEVDRTLHYLSLEEIEGLFFATYIDNRSDQSIRELKNDVILEFLESRDRAMLVVYYGCGLRRSEGIELRLEDIDFDRGLLHVRKGKGNKERYVPFNKKSGDYLCDYIYEHRSRLIKDRRDSTLFISERGSSMRSQSLSLRLKVLQNHCMLSSLKNKVVTLHVLRHSIASHLLESGMKIEQIGRFLGHDSLESTQIYTHIKGEL